ncbi:MAG: RluA family pseudouridine synthase, partial [Amphiplicatus sp.]
MTTTPSGAKPAPMLSFAVAPDDAGARLDKWLSEKIETLTRSRLKALIEEGALARDGKPFVDASWKVRAGETFDLTVPPPVAPVPLGEEIALDVRYEDDDLIVIHKQAGLVVHPASGNWTGTLVNALIAHCGASLSGVGGVARPGIVHRLDKDTSGLLVVAKNDAAHQGLAAQFAAHDIERVYDAVAIGAPRPGVGTIDAPL